MAKITHRTSMPTRRRHRQQHHKQRSNVCDSSDGVGVSVRGVLLSRAPSRFPFRCVPLLLMASLLDRLGGSLFVLALLFPECRFSVNACRQRQRRRCCCCAWQRSCACALPWALHVFNRHQCCSTGRWREACKSADPWLALRTLSKPTAPLTRRSVHRRPVPRCAPLVSDVCKIMTAC